MDKGKWLQKLSKADKKYNFPDGYKLLYSPWETIQKAKIAFISLNPGKPPKNAELKVISDERGNSYEVEKEITESKITPQFLSLCKFLETAPNDVLTGTICPFRSAGWKKFLNGSIFTDEQKRIGLSLGEEFWLEALKKVNIIITVGNETTNLIVKILDAKKNLEINSGWGDVKLRRYENTQNKLIIHLPHLSRFQLFSRKNCIQPLETIFKKNRGI